MHVLADYIKTANTENLLGLNLEQNFITIQGAIVLLDAVRGSTSLFQLSLRRNKIPPVNGPNSIENLKVCMMMFEMIRAA